MGTRISLQTEDIPIHLSSDVGIELTDVPFSGGRDLNAVGQYLVSEGAHEVAERDCPFFFGLFQGGAGVFEIHAVHFFAGEAL